MKPRFPPSFRTMGHRVQAWVMRANNEGAPEKIVPGHAEQSSNLENTAALFCAGNPGGNVSTLPEPARPNREKVHRRSASKAFCARHLYKKKKRQTAAALGCFPNRPSVCRLARAIKRWHDAYTPERQTVIFPQNCFGWRRPPRCAGAANDRNG